VSSEYSAEIPRTEIYDTTTGAILATFDFSIWSMAFNQESNHFLMTGGGSCASIWDIELQQIVASYNEARGCSAIDFRPNGRAVVALQLENQYFRSNIQIIDVMTGRRRHITEFQPLRRDAEFGNSYPSAFEFTFSPSGDYMAFMTTDDWEVGSVYIWNLRTDQRRTVIDSYPSNFSSLTFSPDESLLAFAGGNYLKGGAANLDSSVYVFDIKTGQRIPASIGHNQPAFSVAISSDNRLIVTAGQDGTIRLWGIPAT
jgi:WD40 repeat protein